MGGFHAWLRQRPYSLFMLLGCSSVSMTSLLILSMYLDLVEEMLVSRSLIQCHG
jgi:hypothetical protein